MKRTFFRQFKRFLWMCTVGFMIAWYNVYFQDDKLREDDHMEYVITDETDPVDTADTK